MVSFRRCENEMASRIAMIGPLAAGTAGAGAGMSGGSSVMGLCWSNRLFRHAK